MVSFSLLKSVLASLVGVRFSLWISLFDRFSFLASIDQLFPASPSLFPCFHPKYGSLLVAEDRWYPLNGRFWGLRGFLQLMPLLLSGSAAAFLGIARTGYPSIPWRSRCARYGYLARLAVPVSLSRLLSSPLSSASADSSCYSWSGRQHRLSSSRRPAALFSLT